MSIRGDYRRLRLPEALALCVGWALCAACGAAPDRTYPKPFAGTPLPPSARTADTPAGPPETQWVTGRWEGVSSADCIGDTTANPGRCHATQNITMTMLRLGDQITGYYTCAYGNQVCRNLDETGVIRNVTMSGRRLMLRVMLTDGSMCFFTGIPASGIMEGRYSCLQGGGIVERGAFRTIHSY